MAFCFIKFSVSTRPICVCGNIKFTSPSILTQLKPLSFNSQFLQRLRRYNVHQKNPASSVASLRHELLYQDVEVPDTRSSQKEIRVPIISTSSLVPCNFGPLQR